MTNRPINYNDPSGHCFSGAVVDTIACIDVAVIAGLAILAVATVYVIITPREQIERDMQTVGNAIDRRLQANKPPYVSKRQEDRTNDLLNQVHNVNSGNDTPRLPCLSSWSAFAVCAGLFAAGVVGIHKLKTNGGMGEDESNYHPLTPISTLTTTPQPTSTWTPSPTLTPTLTSTSTFTSTPTNTPALTPTRMPFLPPMKKYSPKLLIPY